MGRSFLFVAQSGVITIAYSFNVANVLAPLIQQFANHRDNVKRERVFVWKLHGRFCVSELRVLVL